MTGIEKAAKSFKEFAEACNEIASNLRAVVECCRKMEEAYTKAKKEHPEWVHKAIHSKKKRIRKKYHDRIMRQYWGEIDG